MIKEKKYHRKHLRAPFRETILYSDGSHLHRARGANISEGGLLIDELPSFPEQDEVKLILAIPQIPSLKNFSLLKMQTFSKDLFGKKVIVVNAKMVRRQELSLRIDNLFIARFGLEFLDINSVDQKVINDYVSTFASNLVFFQMLIDSFNTDDETKSKVRLMAEVLGYGQIQRVAELRALVTQEYKSLQWL
jgi:PilZ domain